jgi:ribosomal protein S17E
MKVITSCLHFICWGQRLEQWWRLAEPDNREPERTVKKLNRILARRLKNALAGYS